MGDNVYATSLNRTATIFPFLLFSRVCVCVSRLSPSVPSLPFLPLGNANCACQRLWRSVGGWGKFLSFGDTKKKNLKIGSAKDFVGKKFPTYSPYFQENKN
jgi:hypothetical protein